MKQNLLSNILIQPNAISEEGVAYLLEHIRNQHTEDLSVFDPEQSNKTGKTEFAVDKNVRDTQIVNCDLIMDDIIDLYRMAVQNIINPFYEFEIRDSEMPQVLSYSVGGHYMPHVDGESLWQAPNQDVIWRKSADRDLSVVFFLNDDFEGGDFVFPELKIRIRPEPGMLIAFPSTHHYLHGVEPVTKGTRYSIVNWMTVKGFPTMQDQTQEIEAKYNIRHERKPNIIKDKQWQNI
jgi:predicted 2-oxoglutarate/Fe(II)-dependent dioxygenase YbiX